MKFNYHKEAFASSAHNLPAFSLEDSAVCIEKSRGFEDVMGGNKECSLPEKTPWVKPFLEYYKTLGRYLAYIFVVFACMMIGCTSEIEPTEPTTTYGNQNPMVMIVKQQSDTSSVDVSDHLMQIFDYTKIPASTYDTELLDSGFTIPASVQLLCVTVSDVQAFTDTQVEQIVSFVAAGNTLLITNPIFDNRFNFLTGIKKNATYQRSAEVEGFDFNQMVFPNYNPGSFKLNAPFIHRGLAPGVFKDKVDIIAGSYGDRNVPVITKNRTGKGQTIFFNSRVAHDKVFRGLLFSLTLPALEGIPYPVANVSTIFLDDFPLPLYDKKSPPIDWEYDLTEEQFITDIWWPDMQALADSFNIDYTAILAFNYNANVVPPFDFREWAESDIPVEHARKKGSAGLAQSVKNSRHELGFHGYNHFSLRQSDWPNKMFMTTALKAARKRWRIDGLGPLPATYVPPTNEIDSSGIKALARTMPHIKNMSSLYLGDIAVGGGREFGPDPYNPNLYDYPRITSGFTANAENIFNFQSLFMLTGVWTHFVHPDDVFQLKQRTEDTFASRNELGLGWRRSKDYDYGLFGAFKERLETIKNTYPLIRFKSAEDAVPTVKAWNALRLERGRIDSMSYLYRQNSREELIDWFVYIDSSSIAGVAPFLQEQAEEYHVSRVWRGYLVQFSSRQDSLVFPNFARDEAMQENPEQIHKKYRAFISSEEESSPDSNSNWSDTRLEDALNSLQDNPSSRRLQDRVIELAAEFDRLPLAIELLEDRLYSHRDWQSDTIAQLLTYYGWENDSERAYDFLGKLWNKHRSMDVIMLKEKMVQRYGAPSRDFDKKWLQRAFALKPNDEEMLEKMIVNSQSEQEWPRTKKYLARLIKQNPASDTLYAYTLQHSFYYDEPEQTLSLLGTFPDTAVSQLEPLAAEIAALYAYTGINYTRALKWADRAPGTPEREKLEWLIAEKRFKAFMERADRAMDERPANDSLRAFVGRELIYNGFYEEGYRRLYPLFEKNNSDDTTRKLVHTEISYQTYSERKAFYKNYPAFFSDSLRRDLQHRHRMQQGLKAGLTAKYASDNFDNTIGETGIFAEWGIRQKYTNRITAGESFIGSGNTIEDLTSRLFHLNYHYQRLWPDKGVQFTASAGFYYDDTLQPDALLGIGFGKDSTFTSARLSLQPEFTTTALQRDITELNMSIYREDYWQSGRLQSTFSLAARRYSNEIYSGELLGRLYPELPFSTKHNRFRGIAELSYADASKTFTNGDPYFTPDRLFIQGAGAGYRYLDVQQNTQTSFELEVMAKHDSENGFYITSAARLNSPLFRYWKLSFDAEVSSSAVYRYNRVGLTISYLFPSKL